MEKFEENRTIKGILAFAPSLSLVTVLYVVPIIVLLTYGVNQTNSLSEFVFTLQNYKYVFNVSNTPYIDLLISTFRLSLIITILSAAIAYPITYYISHVSQPRYKTTLLALVIIPFWTSYLIRTLAWVPILSSDGVMNLILSFFGLPELNVLYTEIATGIGLIYVFVPFMILPLYASMEQLDGDYIEAARDLGASRLRVFVEVIFPLTMPGFAAGAIFVFIKCAASYITPTLLGGPGGILFANTIVTQFREAYNWGLGAALSTVLLVSIVLLLWIGQTIGVSMESQRIGGGK